MRFFTSIHLLLLAYIVAALVYWEIALQKQKTLIYQKDMAILNTQVDSTANPTVYHERMGELSHNLTLRTDQYIGEGTTFLIVILIGAVVVYTSFRRHILLSRQQNNFMLSVTHELKSPIAAMKLNLQTLEKHKLDESKKMLLLERCIRESSRLNDLCNNMLFASQLEGRQYKQARELFDLSALAKDAISEYAARYPRKFRDDIMPECDVNGDRVMLQMAINNLLENAVKYTPADKLITLSLHKTQAGIVMRIEDEGAGIPDAEKKKIFNKFYRIGNEESRKSKGTGLGLYLTNKIVQQHKGRIAVRDNKPSGTVFEINLPL